eukprot:GFKZ01012426.1.p1 GENE.GFKZ01012426.1~~GFKZ01012426.1.p1  ORF type:complete len:930 (+),score=109.64 GFKZ01012426.1:251-3040(+)
MPLGADILPASDASELIDFTCATPWERLALDIELELRGWGLQDGQRPGATVTKEDQYPETNRARSPLEPQPITSTVVKLGDKTLWMELRSHHPTDIWEAHPLERLLGVSECILLTAETPDGIAADDGSDAAVLLSAMAVASSASSCAVPVIVPVGRPSSLRFIGRQLHPHHIRFSCDYTYQLTDDYTHIAGLLKLFQNKRTSAKHLYPPPLNDASITAKFIYEWTDFSFKLAPTPGSFASDRRLNAEQARALSQSDPIRKIRVTAMWDTFSASTLQRNAVLAGLPASTATKLRLSPAVDLLEAIASSQIPSSRIPATAPSLSILRLTQNASNLAHSSNPAAPLPVVDVRRNRRRKKKTNGEDGSSPAASYPDQLQGNPSTQTHNVSAPVALDDFLVQVGEYVAAAAVQDDSIDEQFLTSSVAALFEMDLGRGIMADVVDALGPNAAETTVLERLARLIGASETVNGASKLWNLFLDGVEVHWEHQWIICGVPFNAEDGPNHDESLITQKLQMINCCVERRRREATRMYEAEGRKRNDDRGRKSLLEGVELVGGGDGSKSSSQCATEVWEPHVQPHPLVTRDMVEEELQRMVLRAESSEKGEVLEAKRQSLTLKSDMMAFKAANPTASMADFVRWFSPSDWVPRHDACSSNEDSDTCSPANRQIEHARNTELPPMKLGDQNRPTEKALPASSATAAHQSRRGRLSARMARKGNVWEELWQQAEELPASQQLPLFDAAAHGGKALGDLRAMPMTQVLLHLAAIQGNNAVALLDRAFSRTPTLPNVRKQIDGARQAVREVCATLKLNHSDVVEIGRVAAAVDRVAGAEHTGLIATSVFTKLPPVDGLGHVVDCLACGGYADVVHERERELISRMAGLDDGGWRSVLLPEVREFVITGNDHDERGENMTDRMYARLSRDEFRVAFRLGLDYSV